MKVHQQRREQAGEDLQRDVRDCHQSLLSPFWAGAPGVDAWTRDHPEEVIPDAASILGTCMSFSSTCSMATMNRRHAETHSVRPERAACGIPRRVSTLFFEPGLPDLARPCPLRVLNRYVKRRGNPPADAGGHGDVFWFDTFDFRKIKPSRSNFAWSITTDGVGMCTTFEMPPVAMGSALAASYSPSPGDVVIGNDPGRINIYYMVGLYGGNPAVMKLTRKQYYTESGATSARYKTERWNRGIQTHLDALSTASTKGVSWTAHEWCLRTTSGGPVVRVLETEMGEATAFAIRWQETRLR
ncbi:hypothetical protein CEUSTIGMA_g12177.t1 [Chlamydomonas eustigma]|uniref:Uncharacterized protein n=1 Tax=Chlamydomonas eustigma TaxID=1157962 RepID=A0A250XNT5_9CHLO|nr:hypothetical protein CEUSTIGMA_g12177.t1 [Chlamydomonas eustigma]|eukprot:GAX84755.1 hypothetical protein CEUSTIGMA_g12177.t1 [Chlamydomonas eustigma]